MSEDIRKMIDKVKNFKQFVNEKYDYNNHTTAIIALFYNDKILIIQRGSTAPWMPNKWSLVGGVVDDGESDEYAVKREVKEEIGLTPNNVKLIEKIKTDDIGYITYFTGTIHSNKIKLDYENQNYKFIDKNQINDFDFVPYIKDFIFNLFI
jgi:mutator protein MutT